MRTKEAIMYLLNNPNSKLKMIKNVKGEELDIDAKFIFEIQEGFFVCKGFNAKIHIEDDKSEFEVIKPKLKEMSFVSAFKLIIKEYTYMKSVNTNQEYSRDDVICEIGYGEIDGKWTVEGVYEDETNS